METEYTTSVGYKIFYGALGGVAFIVACALFKTQGDASSKVIYLFPLIMLAVAVMIFMNLFKRKVVITDNSIAYSSVFKTTEITFDHIKGFRVGEKAIFVEPDQRGYAKIRIGDYISIDDYESLKAWLSTNFKDLDKVEYEEEKEAILHDSTLGATEADREQKFNNARKYSIAYSIGGTVLFFGSMILHRRMDLLSYVLLIYPLAGVLLMSLSNGLIRLFAKKSSAYSSIFTGLLFPSVALIIQATVDSEILSYDNAWVPSLLIGFGMIIALYFAGLKKTNESIVGQIIITIIIAAAYGFGSTMQINSVFDQSKPQVFKTTVIDHHVTHGKSTTYHLILGEWGEHHKEDNISVSSSFYDQVQVGSQLKVDLKKGVFNIPWYYVEQ